MDDSTQEKRDYLETKLAKVKYVPRLNFFTLAYLNLK